MIRQLFSFMIIIPILTGGIGFANNTIVNCGKGITVHGVGVSVDGSVLTAEATKIGTKRVYHASAVESNLVVDCTDYAIKIGSNVNENAAAAWAPFDDVIADGEPGNPIVPVRNNMVYNCGINFDTDQADQTYAFQGDSWYRSYNVAPLDNRYIQTRGSFLGIEGIGPNVEVIPMGGCCAEVRNLDYDTTYFWYFSPRDDICFTWFTTKPPPFLDNAWILDSATTQSLKLKRPKKLSEYHPAVGEVKK